MKKKVADCTSTCTKNVSLASFFQRNGIFVKYREYEIHHTHFDHLYFTNNVIYQ